MDEGLKINVATFNNSYMISTRKINQNPAHSITIKKPKIHEVKRKF